MSSGKGADDETADEASLTSISPIEKSNMLLTGVFCACIMKILKGSLQRID